MKAVLPTVAAAMSDSARGNLPACDGGRPDRLTRVI